MSRRSWRAVYDRGAFPGQEGWSAACWGRFCRPLTGRPQVMLMVEYLAARPGQVVGTSELLDALWDRKVVTVASLYACIAELRAALSVDNDGHRYIETIPKRGYRLVARVSDGDPHDHQGGATEGIVRAGGRPLARVLAASIAVALAAVWFVSRYPPALLQANRPAAVVADQNLEPDRSLIMGILDANDEITSVAMEPKQAPLEDHGSSRAAPDLRARNSFLRGRHLVSLRAAESLQRATELFGQAIAQNSVRLNNLGPGPVDVLALLLTGTNPSDFRAPPDFAPVSIAAGLSASLPLEFEPLAVGSRSALLNVQASDGIATLGLNGIGRQPVPIPGAAILLQSALVALVAVFRRMAGRKPTLS